MEVLLLKLILCDKIPLVFLKYLRANFFLIIFFFSATFLLILFLYFRKQIFMLIRRRFLQQIKRFFYWIKAIFLKEKFLISYISFGIIVIVFEIFYPLKSWIEISKDLLTTTISVAWVMLGLLFAVAMAWFEIYKRYFWRLISWKFMKDRTMIIIITNLVITILVLWLEIRQSNASNIANTITTPINIISIPWIIVISLFGLTIIGFVPLLIIYLKNIANNPIADEIIESIDSTTILNPPSKFRKWISSDWKGIFDYPSRRLLEIISINIVNGYDYIVIDIMRKIFFKWYKLFRQLNEQDHFSTIEMFLDFFLDFYSNTFQEAYKHWKRDIIDLVRDCVYQIWLFWIYHDNYWTKISYKWNHFQMINWFFDSAIKLFIKDNIKNGIAIQYLYTLDHLNEAWIQNIMLDENSIMINSPLAREKKHKLPEVHNSDLDLLWDEFSHKYGYNIWQIISESIKNRNYEFLWWWLHIISHKIRQLKDAKLWELQKDDIINHSIWSSRYYTEEAIKKWLYREYPFFWNDHFFDEYLKYGEKYFLKKVENFWYVIICLAQNKQLDRMALNNFWAFGRWCIVDSDKDLYTRCIWIIGTVFEKIEKILNTQIKGFKGDCYNHDLIILKRNYIESYDQLKSIVDRNQYWIEKKDQKKETTKVKKNRQNLKKILLKFVLHKNISKDINEFKIEL